MEFLVPFPTRPPASPCLASEQVDAVYNLPWALAKDLDKSEDLGIRGVNPRNGDTWTQTYQANGMLTMTFGCPIHLREAARPAGRVRTRAA